jgi:hypothetical protein
MKLYGDLDLNDNQAQQASLQTESAFPLTPIEGRVAFKNKRVWICVNTGSLIWIPLGPSHDTYVHSQSSSSTTWTVSHNFATTTYSTNTPLYPMVQVYDTNGYQIIPQDVSYVDDNTVQVSLGNATTGTAVCMYGSDVYYSGLITPQYAYEFTQSTPSSTWVVRHWLGYVPTVRVFDSMGAEIQPSRITVDDAFQVTITFSTPTAGTARLV